MNQPTDSQKQWMDLGYGLFLHFGPNTLQGTGWGDGTFPASQFHVPGLDVAQWAEFAAAAGMKYAVLTAKHHDGFCLWPSDLTDYCVKNATTKTDIVGEFVQEFRKVGMKVGFYYSLWDRHFPQYESDDAYAAYMQGQIRELLTRYGEVVELWFDGAWDKDYPDRQWDSWGRLSEADKRSLGSRWRWTELYELIHSIQPNCLVLNNSGSDYPGGVKYPPVDARTSEHFDFVYNDQLCVPRIDPVFEDLAGGSRFLPLEYCTSLTPDWFWGTKNYLVHPSSGAIADWIGRSRAHKANLLLNIGPNASGVIPAYHLPFLQEALRLAGKVTRHSDVSSQTRVDKESL